MKIRLVLGIFILFSLLPIPSSYATDVSAPVLMEWGPTSGSTDISSKDTKLIVTFILSDESSIKLPSLILKSIATTQTSGLAEVKQTGTSGRLKSFEASVIVRVGQAPKEWEWVLYPLVDEFGNTDNKFGPSGVSNHVIVLLDSTYTPQNRTCERNLKIYNRELEKVLGLEKQYPQFKDDFDLLRLNIKTPLEVQPNAVCVGMAPIWTLDFANIEILNNAADGVIAKIDAWNTARAVADAKAKAEAAAKAKAEAEAKAKAEAAQKKSTITCTKGQKVKKVTAVNPKCPKGYKKK